MEKNTPFRAKKSKMAARFAKKILKVFENMFSMVFEVAESDYGNDFLSISKNKKVSKTPIPLPLNQGLSIHSMAIQ